MYGLVLPCILVVNLLQMGGFLIFLSGNRRRIPANAAPTTTVVVMVDAAAKSGVIIVSAGLVGFDTVPRDSRAIAAVAAASGGPGMFHTLLILSLLDEDLISGLLIIVPFCPQCSSFSVLCQSPATTRRRIWLLSQYGHQWGLLPF
jgi:hypothetical protein